MQCGDSCVSSDVTCVQCGRHHPAHGHGGRAGHGGGDISAPALLRHKSSLITGTVIVKNYVLRNTAVIIVSGEPIEVPSCGAEKICHQGHPGGESGRVCAYVANMLRILCVGT